MTSSILVFIAVAFFPYCKARIYDRCELARELVQTYGFGKDTINDWICLIEHESGYDTAAKGGPNQDGSYDYGLFQINDFYWCTPPEQNNECQVECNTLLSDDIAPAVKCAQLIFSRQNFDAWYGWQNNCRGQDLTGYTADCGL